MDVISPKQIVQGYWSTWNYSRIGGVSSIQIPFSSLPRKRENNLETETPWLQYPWPPGHNWFKASGSRIASSGSRKFLEAAGRNLGYCHICMNWLNNLKSLCKSSSCHVHKFHPLDWNIKCAQNDFSQDCQGPSISHAGRLRLCELKWVLKSKSKKGYYAFLPISSEQWNTISTGRHALQRAYYY